MFRIKLFNTSNFEFHTGYFNKNKTGVPAVHKLHILCNISTVTSVHMCVPLTGDDKCGYVDLYTIFSIEYMTVSHILLVPYKTSLSTLPVLCTYAFISLEVCTTALCTLPLHTLLLCPHLPCYADTIVLYHRIEQMKKWSKLRTLVTALSAVGLQYVCSDHAKIPNFVLNRLHKPCSLSHE